MDQKLLDRFFATTYTKAQALRRVRLLHDFLNYHFFESQNREKDIWQSLQNFKEPFLEAVDGKKLKSSESFSKFRLKSLDFKFLEELGNDFLLVFDPTKLDLMFKELEEALEGAKFVVIYLSIDLPEEEIDRLGVWFKNNLDSISLIEVKIDRSLIAGCALSYRGILKDYSLRQKLNQNKENSRQVLLSYKNR